MFIAPTAIYTHGPGEQYFSFIQDENKFNNIYNPDRKEGRIAQPEQ